MHLTETGYYEFCLYILQDTQTYSQEGLIKNLNAGKYRMIESTAESGEFVRTVLENIAPPEQETMTATSYKLVYTNGKGRTEG